MDAETGEELERLRAQVAQLEHELVLQADRANRVVAEAQQRTYWLERWHVDLDALMRRRGLALVLDTAFRAADKLGRGLKRLRRGRTGSAS